MQLWAKPPAFNSILMYALLFGAPSPDSRLPTVAAHYHSAELSTAFPLFCSQRCAKAAENGALNSGFNYSRPSEMLVSRWIKPGSLSKPIFDLKGGEEKNGAWLSAPCHGAAAPNSSCSLTWAIPAEKSDGFVKFKSPEGLFSLEIWTEMFPHIIRKGKAIDFFIIFLYLLLRGCLQGE